MKNLPSNIAVFIILGLTLVIIGVLAALHVAIPDVVSTIALVAAGGGAGLSLPAVQPFTGYAPAPAAAPSAPLAAAPTFTFPAPVYAPAPAPIEAAPVVSSTGGVTSTFPAPTAPGE